MKVVDLARAVAPDATHEIIGIRPGEKLHEQMIGIEDAMHTFEYGDHFKILPAIHGWCNDPSRINGGVKVAPDFLYNSNTNPEWMTVEQLRTWIDHNREKIGRI